MRMDWGDAAWWRPDVARGEEEPAPERPVRWPKGTQIICPKCRVLVATANRDIHFGETRLSGPWDGIEPQSPFNRCPTLDCDGRYARPAADRPSAELHTDDGWR